MKRATGPATHLFTILTQTSTHSTHDFDDTSSSILPYVAITSAHSGQKVRHGMAVAAFSCGVIFQIIDNYAGSKKTDMSLSSEIRLDTVMGTPLTMKADSCLVNMAAAASSGMNIPEK
jgi:hypothetical protein